MGTATQFLLEELRAARVARGMNQDEFGRLINYSGSHVSAVETGQRPPKPEYVRAVDQALQSGGLFLRLMQRLTTLDDAPVWLRDWILIEREAITLRWFEAAWVPGLLQTEAYARATLTGEPLTPEEVDKLLAARMARQAILDRERPPLLVAVLDEAILHRHAYHDASLMAEQLQHLAACAERPNVQVHVVPASVGMYPGLGGSFIIAELRDGGPMAYSDSQIAARIVNNGDDVAKLANRWERIRSEALPWQQSLELIKRRRQHGRERRPVAQEHTQRQQRWSLRRGRRQSARRGPRPRLQGPAGIDTNLRRVRLAGIRRAHKAAPVT